MLHEIYDRRLENLPASIWEKIITLAKLFPGNHADASQNGAGIAIQREY